MQALTKKWVTVSEFRQIYPAFGRQAYNLVYIEGFPATQITGKWMINIEDVDVWLKSNYGKKKS